MAHKFLTNIDLNKNELQNATVQNLASAPGTPNAGQMYYNTGSNVVEIWNGSAWIDSMQGGGTGTVDTSGTPVVTDFARFTDANTIEGRDATQVKTDLGLVIGTNIQAWDTILDQTTASFLVADETKLDHISVTQAVDLDTMETNIGTNNAKISFDATASAKVGFISVTQAVNLDTIETDANASKVITDFLTVTQAVDLDQMETDIASLANGMVYSGNWDASAGTFPGGGTAEIGAFYTVSVAGTVDSVVFNIGDRLIAIVDSASTTVYASNWTQLDATDAVTTVAGQTGTVTLDADDVTETATKRWLSDTEETLINTFAKGKYSATITGNGALTSFTVNHAMATRDVQVEVYDNTTWDTVVTDIVRTDTNNVSIDFAVAVANLKEYRVVVIG